MHKLPLAVFALIAFALGGCGKPTTTTSGNLEGIYAIRSSTNPGGAPPYKGTVTIAKRGDLYTLDWAVPNTPAYQGVALTSGSSLSVGWGIGGDYGVAVYTIAGKKLSGKWANSRSSSAGTEDLEGPDNLDGTFAIVKGQSPDGKSYTGTVTIHPNGDTYTVTWKLPQSSYSGVAIKNGSVLTVGWGSGGKGAGVVDYEIAGTTLSGRWATPGGTQLGTEVIAK